VDNGIQFERRDQRTRDLFEQLNATLVGKLPTSLLLGRIKACDEYYLSDKYDQVGNEKAIEKFLVDYGALFEVHESELLTAKQKIVELKKPMLLARKIRQWSVQVHERQLVD